ncbi:MAG: RNA polymerase sigma factor [Patescibacteria group bacterium]|nr:RNA polymerase sigma factor [Patescibacteria group bacterium]
MTKILDQREQTDEQLVKLALSDRDNFLYIVNRYKDKLYGYIRKITDASAEDAEDILQEVFLKVYLNLNDFSLDLKFSSWIFRIAHNEVISAYRKKRARPQHQAVSLDETVTESIAGDFNINQKIDAALLQEKISAVLRRIRKECREIIILKFMEEKSYREISDIIKKPMGTVASLMNRAKKEFIAEFKKLYG